MEHASPARDRNDLQTIPGIGPSLSADLVDLGYSCVGELAGADPESMYGRLCAIRGGRVDRCVLYAFRCAVYFAGNTEHDPELLKWWRWKEPAGRAVPDGSRW